jgi:arginine deiminase
MLFDFSPTDVPAGDPPVLSGAVARDVSHRWSVDNEYALLTDVLVSPPPHLEIAPCRSGDVDTLARGLECCAETAARQHRVLVRALQGEGVRCATILAHETLPDLSFTRDSALMTPWGLLGLRPAAGHRRGEAAYVLGQARGWGIDCLGSIGEGAIEGGDVALLRPGTVAIGWSGEGTDKIGALALARLFEARGWKALLTRFDAHFVHLDTLFTMVDRTRALACVEALDPAFVGAVQALGIELVPVTAFEAQRLGTNLLSLGGRRLLSSADNSRVNIELARLGYHVIAVDIAQFTQRGGGVHRLAMPLARH